MDKGQRGSSQHWTKVASRHGFSIFAICNLRSRDHWTNTSVTFAEGSSLSLLLRFLLFQLFQFLLHHHLLLLLG
jgi:hypothetical protein